MLKKLIAKYISDGLPDFITKSLSNDITKMPSAQRMAAVTGVWVAILGTCWGWYMEKLGFLEGVLAWLGFAAAALGFAFMGSTSPALKSNVGEGGENG